MREVNKGLVGPRGPGCWTGPPNKQYLNFQILVFFSQYKIVLGLLFSSSA